MTCYKPYRDYSSWQGNLYVIAYLAATYLFLFQWLVVESATIAATLLHVLQTLLRYWDRSLHPLLFTILFIVLRWGVVIRGVGWMWGIIMGEFLPDLEYPLFWATHWDRFLLAVRYVCFPFLYALIAMSRRLIVYDTGVEIIQIVLPQVLNLSKIPSAQVEAVPWEAIDTILKVIILLRGFHFGFSEAAEERQAEYDWYCSKQRQRNLTAQHFYRPERLKTVWSTHLLQQWSRSLTSFYYHLRARLRRR